MSSSLVEVDRLAPYLLSESHQINGEPFVFDGIHPVAHEMLIETVAISHPAVSHLLLLLMFNGVLTGLICCLWQAPQVNIPSKARKTSKAS